MTSPIRRLALCGLVLTCGLAAQAGLTELSKTDRPPLRRSLTTLPLELGDWVGQDAPMDPEVLRQAQSTEYVNRTYESKTHPGLRLGLWINYSDKGDNLRHSPDICLPSKGYVKMESRCRVLTIAGPDGAAVPISRLAYAQGELFQAVGFWYYIFGEGPIETYVRGLPITSRSSHGRTTRGSSLTVEVFGHGADDPGDQALQEFAAALLAALEPVLPESRAEYYVP